MKKSFTIFTLASLFALGASAQLTLTSSSGYKPGDIVKTQMCSTGGIILSDAGANVNVDYSGAMPLGSVVTQNYVSPAGSPFQSSFPAATASMVAQSQQGNSAYTYFRTTNDKMELLGIATSQLIMVYSDPMVAMSFPLTYGDSIYDTFKAAYSASGISIKRSGYISIVADAYGNITTPDGTFQYLRMNIIQVVADSMYMASNFMGVTNTATYTYNYMNSSNKTPIFTYSTILSDQSTSESCQYGVDLKTGVKEISNSIADVKVYPNPVNGSEFEVSFNNVRTQPVSLRVIDITGKEVKNIALSNVSAGGQHVNVNVNDMAAGFYTVLISTPGNETKAVKLNVVK